MNRCSFIQSVDVEANVLFELLLSDLNNFIKKILEKLELGLREPLVEERELNNVNLKPSTYYSE